MCLLNQPGFQQFNYKLKVKLEYNFVCWTFAFLQYISKPLRTWLQFSGSLYNIKNLWLAEVINVYG